MVDARRAELAGELHSGTGAELVAVDAEPESALAPRLEHRARLLPVEGVRRSWLAEDVDVCRWAGFQPIGEECVEHGSHDEVDIVRTAIRVLGRDHVGAEEGRVRA